MKVRNPLILYNSQKVRKTVSFLFFLKSPKSNPLHKIPSVRTITSRIRHLWKWKGKKTQKKHGYSSCRITEWVQKRRRKNRVKIAGLSS